MTHPKVTTYLLVLLAMCSLFVGLLFINWSGNAYHGTATTKRCASWLLTLVFMLLMLWCLVQLELELVGAGAALISALIGLWSCQCYDYLNAILTSPSMATLWLTFCTFVGVYDLNVIMWFSSALVGWWYSKDSEDDQISETEPPISNISNGSEDDQIPETEASISKITTTASGPTTRSRQLCIGLKTERRICNKPTATGSACRNPATKVVKGQDCCHLHTNPNHW